MKYMCVRPFSAKGNLKLRVFPHFFQYINPCPAVVYLIQYFFVRIIDASVVHDDLRKKKNIKETKN